MSDLFTFLKTEYEKVKEVEKQRSVPVYKLVDGDNKLIVDVSGTREWRRINTRFGERVVIPVYTLDQKEHVLMVNPNSRLYTQLVKQITEYLFQNRDAILIGVVITRYRVGARYSYDVKIIPPETEKKPEEGQQVERGEEKPEPKPPKRRK